MDHIEKFNMILKEWRKFIDNIPVTNNYIISSVIMDSWERCKAKKVNPYLTKVPVVLEGKVLEALLGKNEEIIDISLPFMENLHGFFKGSGFLVALFDADGYILKLVGDEDVITRVRKGNFVVGACWSEEIAGTNGGGTVIKVDRPIQVFACEHYCVNSHKWTCSGAPIHNPDGKLIGIIDLTGPYHKANPHTLGMAAAAANAIENALGLKKALNRSRIAESFQKTVIASIPEAIITADNNGIISLINDNARNIFNSKGTPLIGKHLKELFGEDNEAIPKIIMSNESVTDMVVRINGKNNSSDYTMTCSSIMCPIQGTIGKIAILNEINRAKTLVNKIIGAKAKFHFDNIIGENIDFLKTILQAKMASLSLSNVLLLGESGTGKDIFAQAIHNASPRRDGPYVAINCGAIPRDLITSELFGYSDGAFTGSRRGGNQGKFELADRGTIFLDEIGETPLELQIALLRVMEDKCIMRIGGAKYTPVDVRIIAATNKNLREEVRKGSFREDLYYRSNVFSIQLLSLRERPNDIPLLAEAFMKNIGQAMGKQIRRITPEVIEKFINYSWPGNVRELQNVIERMINVAHTDELSINILPSEILQDQNTEERAFERIETLKEIEHKTILTILNSNFTKKEIANKLGISRSTLYRKLENRH